MGRFLNQGAGIIGMATQAVKFCSLSRLTMFGPGPVACDLCGVRLRGSTRLCPQCEADLPRLENACDRCAIPLPVEAETCAHCVRKPPAFDRCRAPFLYQFPIDAMIRRYKFHQALDLGRILGERLAAFLARDLAERPQRIDVLVPVPLHVSRLRERGYNQATELARTISAALGLPVRHDLCARTRPTEPQARLSATERVRNMRGAFAANGEVSGLRLAIVDDVVTSGQTASVLAKVLRRAGAIHIEVWALARAGV